ncbi:MAG TPA: helix-turn-helix domain-containing protein [Allosphingosinicella sp.]|nr:helix-turn-helix domain-containing protein [Allosphingosinicella sp.]
MAFSSDNIGDELLDSINRPFRDLPDLLEALMRALAARTRLVAGSLSVEGRATLLLRRTGYEFVSEWIDEEPGGGEKPGRRKRAERREAEAVAATRSAGDMVLPISYAETPLGELRLRLDPPAPSEAERGLLSYFARHCGLLINRYHVRNWSQRRLGRPLLLIGLSKALRDLEAFVEISARGRLPVLLRGEFGTEKAQVAATIHCCGPTSNGPFVQVDCAVPGNGPAEWMERAQGGTLFLGDIDELDPRLQRQLPQFMPSQLHQWLQGTHGAPVRIIASTTADLHQRAREGLFSRSLLAELDFLSATIPPLRDRPGDIEALICHALEQNGYRPEEKRTDALVDFCGTYDWPENLFELERTVARLAVLTEKRPIGVDDMRRHAPAIVPAGRSGWIGSGPRRRPSAAEAAADHWVRCATGGEPAALASLHHALRKALLKLGSHYEEPISLGQLAREAGVSPSHLGFLFRTVVGMPFKVLLGHIRIRKARELLTADTPRNITQVAMSVGFSDLSHFEKSFRRIVGESPREYRRNASLH